MIDTGMLVSRLSLPEAVGLSLSVICPTVTAAFNVTLVVQAAGPAAPLTFAIGTLAMAGVAVSFMRCTRRAVHAGSAYAYIARACGGRAGFVAGWMLLLTYLAFATGLAALVGSFTAAVVRGVGHDVGAGWLWIGGGSMLAAWWLAFRDMRFAGRLMLVLEGAAVVGILVLCASILIQAQPSMAQSLTSFRPSAEFGGWTGVGVGLVYCILSFAGFEGAATLGEETRNPRRNIPIAMLGTVVGSGVFFIFVTYCEVVGFGSGGIGALARSEAPLNDLAVTYASPALGVALDAAAAISCFSGVIGSLAAAARLLFALGRGGLAPGMGAVHAVHGTPAAAVSVSTGVIVVAFFCWAPFVGAANFYAYATTIGVLSLILVYIGVGGADLVEGWHERHAAQLPVRWSWVLGFLGPLLLLWVLYRNVVPVPEYPNDWWPYVVAAWMACAWAVMRARPAILRPVPK